MAPPQVGLDEIDLAAQEFWALPDDWREGAYQTLRQQETLPFYEELEFPPLPRGPGFYAVTRHRDILEASRQPEVFSSAQGITLLDTPVEFNEFFGSMISMDDPRHARLRRIVSRGFTPLMLKSLEDRVDLVARRIVAGVAERGACDFVVDIAAPLPLEIVCDMMGIPASQHASVFHNTNIILGPSDPEYVAQSDTMDVLNSLLAAGGELAQLMAELGRLRREHPVDDLTSALVNAEVDGERLTDAELASFFILLVAAGNETTRNAISHGMLALTTYPAQLVAWQADFDRLAAGAVEEIVRWASPVIYMRRTTTQATTLGGTTLAPGAKVALFYAAANRDEAVFERPHEFDIRRHPNDHLGFGGPGPHFCLGAHLARREITVMFRELFRTLPDLRISGDAQPLFSNFIHGIKHLPCQFSPTSA